VQNDPYSFHPVSKSDLPLLSVWLKDPAVARWYEDDDYIEDLEESLDDTRIRMQLVLFDAEPIAYVQDYDIHAWSDHHFAYLPVGSRGIDTFIGSSDQMGKGHGTHYLNRLIKQLFAERVPALGIDPEPENTRARQVYRKIGFAEDGESASEWGDVVLMSLRNPMLAPQN